MYFVISYSESNSSKRLRFLYKGLSKIFSKQDAALILLGGLSNGLYVSYRRFTTASHKILERQLPAIPCTPIRPVLAQLQD